MTIPDYQSLMLPVLRSAGSDEISMSECRERVARDLGLSDEDLAQRYPNGGGETIFANRVAWAKIYLTAAGVLDATRRGYFRISDEGHRLLAENPSRIDNTLLRRYPRFIAWLRREPINTNMELGETSTTASQNYSVATETQTPEDLIESNFARLVAALRNEVLSRVRGWLPLFLRGS